MPSGGSYKVKHGLPSTLFLVFDAPCISSFTLFNFPENYTIVSNLNESELLHLLFHYEIFLTKSSQ